MCKFLSNNARVTPPVIPTTVCRHSFSGGQGRDPFNKLTNAYNPVIDKEIYHNGIISSKMKGVVYSLIIWGFIVTLGFMSYSIVHAQSLSTITATGSAIVISDYALDIQNGQKDIANDSQAQQNQKDEQDNENVNTQEVDQEGVKGTESKDKIEPKEAVEPKEVETEGEESKSDTNVQQGDKTDNSKTGDQENSSSGQGKE